jgi:hypothetical protein
MWLTPLLLTPSATATQIPFEVSAGSSGMQAP